MSGGLGRTNARAAESTRLLPLELDRVVGAEQADLVAVVAGELPQPGLVRQRRAELSAAIAVCNARRPGGQSARPGDLVAVRSRRRRSAGSSRRRRGPRSRCGPREWPSSGISTISGSIPGSTRTLSKPNQRSPSTVVLDPARAVAEVRAPGSGPGRAGSGARRRPVLGANTWTSASGEVGQARRRGRGRGG